MLCKAKETHRNNYLGRIVEAGEFVDIPEDLYGTNKNLYDKASASEERRVLPKEEAIKIILDKKLAKPSEIDSLSLKQIREMAEGAL